MKEGFAVILEVQFPIEERLRELARALMLLILLFSFFGDFELALLSALPWHLIAYEYYYLGHLRCVYAVSLNIFELLYGMCFLEIKTIVAVSRKKTPIFPQAYIYKSQDLICIC